MIILDTGAFSAVLKRQPPDFGKVVSWLDHQQDEDLCITTITLFEILSGIEKMPDGKKRRMLEQSLSQAVGELLTDRVLPFDRIAAKAAGDLYGARRRDGLAVGSADTQIAGIAIAQNASIATRNVRHFADLQIPVINPWEA